MTVPQGTSIILILPKSGLLLKPGRKAKLLQHVLITGLIFVHSVFADSSPSLAQDTSITQSKLPSQFIFYLKEMSLSQAE